MKTNQPLDQLELERTYDALYEQYGKPLEKQHKGEYLAVSRKGATLLGPDLSEVTLKAAQQFGPGNFVYKVGERSVGRWR